MFERYTLFGLVFSVAIIILNFYLLRERKIRGKAFVFWLMVGGVLGLFSLAPNLIGLFDLVFGFQYTISGILVTVFMFFLVTIFYFQYRINELQNMLTKLAMEVSVRKYSEDKDPNNLSMKPHKNESHEDE